MTLSTVLSVGFGFVGLLLGGGLLVRGSVAVAERLGVSKLLVGLVLVGFGTSTPELVTSLKAALSGSPGIALGNVIGSNIANVLLILGITAVLCPIPCDPRAFRRDAVALASATGLCVAVTMTGEFQRLAGLAFLAGLAGYLVVAYRMERTLPDHAAAVHTGQIELAGSTPRSLSLGLGLALGGMALIVGGAHFLVVGAVDVAVALGISEAVVGLTLVAVGTSLPELTTSMVAAMRKQTDLAFGNIIGSNLFNILGILGVTALVQPIPVPAGITSYDLWFLAGSTVLVLLFAMTRWRVSRAEGLIFLLAYAGYIALILWRA